jgi:hypothetical protein
MIRFLMFFQNLEGTENTLAVRTLVSQAVSQAVVCVAVRKMGLQIKPRVKRNVWTYLAPEDL